MSQMIKFISVDDPLLAEASHGRGTHSQLPVHGIAIGALDRFTEDFQNHLMRYFPDMVPGDDLTVYHQHMTNEEIAPRIRKISLWCIGWAGYNDWAKIP